MMMTQCRQFLAACAAVLILCAYTFAGTIDPNPTVSGPGLGMVSVPVVSTGTANNDNFPTDNQNDNNIVVPLKQFANNDYIDIVFTVTNSGGITEYRVAESIDNDTGVNWSRYHMQLGYNTGIDFVMSGANDGLDFDAPFFDSPPDSTSFSNVSLGTDELIFSGGIQGTALELFNIRIDVPDLNGTFTLRQFPVPVPEPSTVFMLAAGCLGLSGLAKRRRP